jgi:hypothetical protein
MHKHNYYSRHVLYDESANSLVLVTIGIPLFFLRELGLEGKKGKGH